MARGGGTWSIWAAGKELLCGKGVAVHRAFAQSERLNFPLLSDASQNVVIRSYGVLGSNGLPQRVTFIIGPDGTVRGKDGGNVDRQFTRSGATLVSQHGENVALLLSDGKAHIGATVPNFFLPGSDGTTVPERALSVIKPA